MSRLTDNELEVYEFVKEFIRENRLSPTLREIMDGTSISSTSTASRLVDRLAERNFVIRNPEIARGIKLPEICGFPVMFDEKLEVGEIRLTPSVSVDKAWFMVGGRQHDICFVDGQPFEIVLEVKPQGD